VVAGSAAAQKKAPPPQKKMSDWDACQGRFEKADEVAPPARLEACNRVLVDRKLAKDSFAWATMWRGMVHGVLGNADRKVADLNKALEINPRLDRALHFRALHFLEIKPELAIADLKRIQADKFDQLLMPHLSLAYEYAGKHDDARAEYTKWMAIRWPNQSALLQRAGFHVRIGDFAAALHDLEQAQNLDAEAAKTKGADSVSTTPRCLRTWVLYLKGEKEKAFREAKGLIETTEQPTSLTLTLDSLIKGLNWRLSGDCHRTHGLALAERGDLEATQKYFGELEFDPDKVAEPGKRQREDVLLTYARALAYDTKKNAPAARRDYERVTRIEATHWDDRKFQALARQRLMALPQ
jgi:tetratricopeptide (TPR) repeat protein